MEELEEVLLDTIVPENIIDMPKAPHDSNYCWDKVKEMMQYNRMVKAGVAEGPLYTVEDFEQYC